jgi:hypothetical protein
LELLYRDFSDAQTIINERNSKRTNIKNAAGFILASVATRATFFGSAIIVSRNFFVEFIGFGF